MSRDPDTIQDGMLATAYEGWALPRSRDSYFGGRFRPLAEELARLEASFEAMLPEVDPRTAPNLLPDYERVLGPDPCQRDTAAFGGDRATLAWQRWTQPDGIYAGWFIQAALAIGETITVEEFPACALGTWELGAMMLTANGEECAVVFTLPATHLTYFELGVSEIALTALGDWTTSLMECVIQQNVPLHVTPYFSYTS